MIETLILIDNANDISPNDVRRCLSALHPGALENVGTVYTFDQGGESMNL